MIDFIIWILIVMVLLFVICIFIFPTEYVLLLFTSMIVLIMGLYFYIYGIYDLNNWVTRGVGIVLMGIGLTLFITKSLEFIENS